jgi:hypothetical protein
MSMEKPHSDYLELAYRSIQCFANDGKLLMPELDQLIAIALQDGVVDEQEKRILRSILSRLKPVDLTPEMRARIDQLRSLHNV